MATQVYTINLRALRTAGWKLGLTLLSVAVLVVSMGGDSGEGVDASPSII